MAPEDGPIQEIFFAGLNHSPTDRPEHFMHVNGAIGLLAVWTAGSDLSDEKLLLQRLGAEESHWRLPPPSPTTMEVMRFNDEEVWLLPSIFAIVPSHRMVGVTVRTKELDKVLATLQTSGIRRPPVIESTGYRSLFIPPQTAHGRWLAFRESATP
jgi:hypothetical protein